MIQNTPNMANFSVSLYFKITVYIQFDDSYDFSFCRWLQTHKKIGAS